MLRTWFVAQRILSQSCPTSPTTCPPFPPLPRPCPGRSEQPCPLSPFYLAHFNSFWAPSSCGLLLEAFPDCISSTCTVCPHSWTACHPINPSCWLTVTLQGWAYLFSCSPTLFLQYREQEWQATSSSSLSLHCPLSWLLMA